MHTSYIQYSVDAALIAASFCFLCWHICKDTALRSQDDNKDSWKCYISIKWTIKQNHRELILMKNGCQEHISSCLLFLPIYPWKPQLEHRKSLVKSYRKFCFPREYDRTFIHNFSYFCSSAQFLKIIMIIYDDLPIKEISKVIWLQEMSCNSFYLMQCQYYQTDSPVKDSIIDILCNYCIITKYYLLLAHKNKKLII